MPNSDQIYLITVTVTVIKYICSDQGKRFWLRPLIIAQNMIY